MKRRDLGLIAHVAVVAVAGIALAASHLLERHERVFRWRLSRAGRLRTVAALAQEQQRRIDIAFARLQRLRPAGADRARVSRMFALYNRALRSFDAAIDALSRHDVQSFIRLVRQGAAPARRANRIATALGAAVCAG